MSYPQKTETLIRFSEESVTKIVAAFASRVDVPVTDIVKLLKHLSTGLVPKEMQIERAQGGNGENRAPIKPALSANDAVTHDKVYCMCCGRGFSMLKRHLGAEHGLSEGEYRKMFSLADDFPLVAPSYSDRKAAYAKQAGLGKYSRDHKVSKTDPS